MKIHKLILGFAFLFLIQNTQAQKNYYPFAFQELDGLTDSLNNEIIKPLYNDHLISDDKKVYVFKYKLFSDSNVLYFDAKTGLSNTNYKYVFLDDLIIKDQSYHYFSDEKSFFQNSETGEIAKTKEDVYSAENIGGRYIVAKFHPTAADRGPSKPLLKDKNGIYLPPAPSLIYTTFFVFYPNALPLTAALKIEADEYIPLYDTNEIDDAYYKSIQKYNSPDFDYLLFKKGNKLHLYDKNLKLIKVINYPNDKAEKELDGGLATKEASKVIGKEVYHFYKVYPSMAPSMGSSNSERKREAFEVVKSPEGLYQFIRTKDEKVVFTSSLKMDYYDRTKRVLLEDKDEKRSFFFIDKVTGIPYLPTKYIAPLNIIINP